jgi:NAD(P)-dependent dehydrogenase (short-subunit alcohol dehydrogenase family)
MNLEGKAAIVTGAGGPGSGRAEACRLATEGCRVVVSDIDEAGGEGTVRLIEANGGLGTFFRCDVSVREQVRALITFAEQTYGGVDILVNNASGPNPPGKRIEQWYATIQTDLLGAIYGVEFASEAMRKRGGGAIINVSSTSALGHGAGHSFAPPYDIAKIGVVRLTTALAGLSETANIRVNCLVPDWIATSEIKQYFDTLTPEQRTNPRIPSRLTTLEEIAQAAVDLITDSSLAGRVLVLWSGQKPALIARMDPGYAALEPYGG